MTDRRVWIGAVLVVVALLAAACGDGTEEYSGPVTAVRLPMGYIPDPQYAPFYVALDKGYFREAGFEVEFDYSYETDGVALVGAGELPFAIVSGDQVILARAQDVPVVYVMEWFQRFPIAVISKVEAGIQQPEDLAGRNVGLPGFFGASYVGYAGLLEAAGLSEDDVNANDIGFTQVETLLADQAEAVVVYANNEPLQMEALGQEINIINVADYVDMVANGLITNETMIAEDPEQVRRFVGATLKGLADTLADPQGAFEISKKYVEGLEDERYPILAASLTLWQSDTPGVSEIQSWQRTQDALLAIGFLDAPLDDLQATFTNQFVE
ncbi:MAG: ABC transporter substrate-binding protein [Chloroflexota bacterium]|jgi:NitT/TauT family transport system substrate-binding protein